jgi:hypothetical protein
MHKESIEWSSFAQFVQFVFVWCDKPAHLGKRMCAGQLFNYASLRREVDTAGPAVEL